MTEEQFEAACLMWIKSDSWRLEDAIRLINKKLPECFSTSDSEAEDQQPRHVRILNELIKNNLNGTLTRYPPIPGEPETTIRINPFEFLDWLEEIAPEQIPVLLKMAKAEHEQQRKGTTRKDRPETIHRHRVAALAELLWRDEPNLTKVEMSQKPELTAIGCHGKKYTLDTLQRWIKESNPNREPGRRS